MNNPIYDIYFFLLKCVIRRLDPVVQLQLNSDYMELLREAQWNEVLGIATKSKTTALLYPAVAGCAPLLDIDPELLSKWQKLAQSDILQQLQKHQAIRVIHAEAQKRGLTIIFFKGILLAELYPHYTQRRSFDTDILVSDDDEHAVMGMLEDLGYKRNEERSKNHVQFYSQQLSGSIIELHTRLWEDFDGKRIEVLESLNLSSPESLIRKDSCGMSILTLDPRRHLVYQIFHIVKHFVLDGVGVRYLADITLFIESNRESIDFQAFWCDMASLGYTRFCRQIFTICNLYLGFNSDEYMEGRAVIDADTRSLLLDMMRGGTANDENHHYQILGTMIPYFVGEKKLRKTKFGRKMANIFLRPSDLTCEYNYAKKFIVLLPVAWVHRAFKYFFYYYQNKKYWYSVNEKLDVAEYRLHLLNRMGLVDEKK